MRTTSIEITMYDDDGDDEIDTIRNDWLGSSMRKSEIKATIGGAAPNLIVAWVNLGSHFYNLIRFRRIGR